MSASDVLGATCGKGRKFSNSEFVQNSPRLPIGRLRLDGAGATGACFPVSWERFLGGSGPFCFFCPTAQGS